ncbi:hypothetical protein DFJ73DRAFT_851278 [Zopfochytrium polystomum]|nr:hypothetical protein DFJ73DRAFT_851278 [Zopfochytrium polystomum]
MSASLVNFNQDVAGLILVTVVAISFREQLGRITNKHLFVSICLALTTSFITCLANSAADSMTITDDMFPAFVDFLWLPGLTTVATFGLLSYHTTYRSVLLIFPHKKSAPVIVGAIICFIEVAVNLADLSFFQMNLKSMSPDPDPRNQKTSMFMIVYVSTVDTLFFTLSQVRIISSWKQMNKVEVGIVHYIDAILRCACYSGSVFLFFMTASGLFFPASQGWIYMYIAPSLMCIVLLTDSDRVRKLIDTLQGKSTGTKTSGGGQTSVAASSRRSTVVPPQ